MIVIVLIVLMSFGVSRQAIKYPDQDWSWHSVKEIFLEPYFMVRDCLLKKEFFSGFVLNRYMEKCTQKKSIHHVIERKTQPIPHVNRVIL